MLELKIPPVVVTILSGAAMWGVAKISSAIPLPLPAKAVAASLFLAAGAYCSIAGVCSFREAETTVNPTTPDASSALVTSGIYRRTRNPMYVGFLFFLLSLSAVLSNPWSLLVAAGFVLYMNRFQIVPEERALQSIFGDEYVGYKARVRRWL